MSVVRAASEEEPVSEPSTSQTEITAPARTLHRLVALANEVAPGLLIAAALTLFLIRIDVPQKYVFDEVYHSYTAGQYVAHNRDAYVWSTKPPRAGVGYTWNHPPLGVHLISWGIYLFGDWALGWRFMSAIFGALGVAIAYLLGRAVSGRPLVGWLAAALLMCDGIYLVQSRTGMLDIFGTVFMMAALLAFHRALTVPPERARWPLVATGACVGLAMATKWNAVHPSFLLGLWLLVRTVRLGLAARRDPTPQRRRGFAAHVQGLVLGFGVLPPLIYLAAYIPFFVSGYSFAQLIELQKQTFIYHAHLHATHAYQSAWWQWPLALRPVWFHVTYASGTMAHIYSGSNPFLAWAMVPAVVACSIAAWRRRDAVLGVLLIGFFGQWLPWALIPRIAFVYHFLPATTIGALAVAMAAGRLIERGGLARATALSYLLIVLAAAIFFFPIHTAIPLTPEAVQTRMWLPSWR
jgi:dolichyl-phosphate-mannose-protein mannosyltransferase